MKLTGLTLVLFSAPALAQEAPRGGGPPQDEAAQRGLRIRADGAHDGVTLVAPLRSTSTYLVDANGETLHSWPSAFTPGNSAYLLDDGSILRCAKDAGDAPFRGGGEGGRIQRIAWDGTVVWDFAMADETWRQHHDIEPLPNGNVLAIVWEGVSRDDAIAAGRDEDNVGDAGMWPDAIVELRPVGNDGAEVVWRWSAWDHLVQDRDPGKPNHGVIADHPHRVDVNYDRADRPKTAEEIAEEEAVAQRLRGLGYGGGDDDEGPRQRRGRTRSDWMHTNSIDYDATTDLIAISVREASEVWIIDHSTTTAQAATGEGGRYGRGGDILYRFGRPASWRAEGEQMLFHQHDARFVPADGGLRVTVFNNGDGREGGDRSTADEIALPFTAGVGFAHDDAGRPVAPSVAWSWGGGDEVLFNGHISGAQRLANGNTLMCMGEDGRVLEVTRDGDVVWEWLQAFRPTGGERGERRERPRRGERGERPERGGPPRGGPPRDGGRPPRGGPDGRRGGRGGPQSQHAIFRATRYERSHAGLSRL